MLTAANLNSFTLKERLEEMIVYESITMKDIYEEYKKFRQNKNEIPSPKIKFFNYNNELFDFQIGDIRGNRIQTEPIEIKINGQTIDIICDEQVEFIKGKYKVDSISCKDDNINNIDFELLNLLDHKRHNITIFSSYLYSMYKNQDEINSFLQKFNDDFINKVFKTPQEFEKNFEYYFNMNQKCIVDGAFTIFEDFNSNWRTQIVREINKWIFGNCYIYYGSSGKGKSITLIGALKYGQKSEPLGTFYINCKTLRVLYKKLKTNVITQILIDEIVFLFRHSYDNYEKCCEIVKNFSFKNEYDFWNLIEEILDYINKIDGYYFIISFDQYNNENDKERKLIQIRLKYLGSEKIKIIVFSSMNEKDIRLIKQNFLLLDNIIKKDTNTKILELRKVCSIIPLGFNNKQKEVFNLLGKTMKAYFEIRYHKASIDSIDKYIIEKKEKLKFKILCFYKKVEEKKELYYDNNFEIDINNHIGDILSFSPNEEYTKKELIKIIDKVPFRYFDIEKTINNNFIIKYSFPLIEQIFIDIYKSFLLKNSFKRIKEITKGSGAFGCIFEYAVIFYILQKSQSKENTIFNYFHISKNLTVKKFVLKENESFQNLIFEKQALDVNHDYIIEQEVFCGKTLDFLLIHFINSDPYVYGFQVSIYKKIIFELSELELAYETLRALLKEYFNIDFKKENMFFGYIFNYEDIKTNKYLNMLQKCDDESLKYCFYEPYLQKFLDKFGNEIKNIDNITTKVFRKIRKTITNLDEFIFYPLTINYPNITIEMNQNQHESLTDLVKKIFNSKAKWKIIKKTKHNEYYQSYNKWAKYFFFYFDGTYLRTIFYYKLYKVYKLLLTGEIEEDFNVNLNADDEIFICEVYG